jgi:hypothetical protein
VTRVSPAPLAFGTFPQGSQWYCRAVTPNEGKAPQSRFLGVFSSRGVGIFIIVFGLLPFGVFVLWCLVMAISTPPAVVAQRAEAQRSDWKRRAEDKAETDRARQEATAERATAVDIVEAWKKRACVVTRVEEGLVTKKTCSACKGDGKLSDDCTSPRIASLVEDVLKAQGLPNLVTLDRKGVEICEGGL